MNRRRLAALLLAMSGPAGCRSERSEPAGPPATPAVVTVNGRSLPVVPVLATSDGGRAVMLHFGTHPLTCADALQNGYSPRPGELRFDVTVAPIVGDDGALDWHVQGVVFSGNDMRMQGRAIVEAADAAPGGRLHIRLHAEAEFAPDGRVVVDGAVVAVGCGVQRHNDAPLRPQPVRIAPRRRAQRICPLANSPAYAPFTERPSSIATSRRVLARSW